MRIQFFGAAHTVTGSQYLIDVNGHRLLLECGMFQGRREESFARNRSLPFDVKTVEAAILSHAHIDHSGNLPNLVKSGYSGPIYATHATADLADVMLQDSGHIQEADAVFVNKRNASKGLPPVEPIYTLRDALEVAGHFRSMDYEAPFQPVPGVTARLFDAGHILGSAAIVLDVEEGGRKFRFWFSGDIGRENTPILRDPVFPQKADYLMMESTYGDKPHEEFQDAVDEFRDVVLQTARRGGKVIVPTFAVGRTQEMVYALNQMEENGDLPHIPVYVDSPLAVNATEIFEKHTECYDDETRAFIQAHKHPALEFPGLKYIHSVDESKALNGMKGPMVILAASGMAETGRILHHLRNNIEDPRNSIAIVSWQAPQTLGRRLAEREKRVRIFGEEFTRRADVFTIGGLSAHAGQTTLVKYALAAKDTVKRIILVHGEEAPAMALKQKLVEAGLPEPVYPDYQEAIEI